MTEYDVIIIGAGPNGETTAAYLQKAGAKCLLIERRDEMGGGLATQDFGGFRFNLHATYMMMGELMPPYHDLFLPQYGVNFTTPPVQASFFYEKNKSLVLYLDPKKSADSVAKIAPEDKEKFLRFYTDMKEVGDKCLLPATYGSPMAPAEYAAMLSQSEIGQKVLEWSEMSPLEMLERYEIKDERVRGALLYLGCKWGIEPDLIGIGYMFAIYSYRMQNASLVGGGTHRLNSGLMRSGYESGLEVMENTEVQRIVIEDGEAKGVIVDDGKEIRARAVVSSLNPKMTFLEMVGQSNLQSDFVETIEQWQWDEWSLFCMHLGLRKFPRYKAEDNEPHCGEAFMQILGYESVDNVAKHWKDCMDGKLPGAAGTFSPISLFDPTQAPEGFNVMRVESEVPYEIVGKRWEEVSPLFAVELLKKWQEHLSDPSSLRLVKKFLYPPTWIEMKLPNMVRGSIKQGAYTPTQMGYFRPNTECSNYNTPIKGLYLSSAAVYPGGMITLGPGYNAAKKIAADLNLKIWWKDLEYVAEARRNNLIP